MRPAVGMTVFITVGRHPAKLRAFIILFNPYTMPARQMLGTSFCKREHHDRHWLIVPEFELNLSDEKALFPAPVLTAPSSSGVGPRQKFPTRAWYQEALKQQTPGTELVINLAGSPSGF